jgi:GNAT superfamily N-acetyltransferase
MKTRALTPDMWGDLERLFGPRGVGGGCWCQWPMVGRGERLRDVKGPEAKARMAAQVKAGRQGVVAYEDDVPVGWLSFGPRLSLPGIARSRVLACEDAEQVWSVACFYVKTGSRRRGAAVAMLGHAVALIRAQGGRLVEGYPMLPPAGGTSSVTFLWPGSPALFARFGFARVDDKAVGRIRMRLRLEV